MRVTITLPDSMVKDLDFSANRLGVTRSGLVAGLLQEVVPPVRILAGAMPKRGRKASAAEIKRFRGTSAKLISDLLTQAILGGVQSDLFSK